MDERREAAYFRRETEEAEISQRKRRMTPRERDAFIDEYNAKLLTPEERDRFVQEYNAEHPFSTTDSKTDEKDATTQDDNCRMEKELSSTKEQEGLDGGPGGEPTYQETLDVKYVAGEDLPDDRNDLHSLNEDNIRRVSLERGIRAVRMCVPEVRGVEIESMERLHEIIGRDFPGVKKHRDYEMLMANASLHMKTIEEFGSRETVPSGKIRKFMKEIGVAEATGRAWIVKGAKPRIYILLDEAMSKPEGEAIVTQIRENLNGVDSIAEVDQRLSHPYHESHTKIALSYPRERELTEKYFQFLDEMAEGGTIGDVSWRVGIDRCTAQLYIKGRIPWLVQKAMESPGEVREYKDDVCIDSKEKLQELIQRHPDVMEIKGFPKMLRHANAYLDLKEWQRNGGFPEMMQKDVARDLGISSWMARLYLSNEKRPKLFQIFFTHERARVKHESKLAPKALEHRIDPSYVHEKLKSLKSIEKPEAADLAKTIEDLYRASPIERRVQFAELRPYYGPKPRWLREVAKRITNQREEVERLLNERLGLANNPNSRLRIGVVKSKLYLRLQDTREANWMNLYGREMFQFGSLVRRKQLLEDACRCLGLRGIIALSQLVGQVTDYDKTVLEYQPNSDLSFKHTYLKGETLHLVLDALGMKIQDIEGAIERMGRGKLCGIRNPKFPEDPEEIDRIFAQIIGGGLSDGNIAIHNRTFSYGESDRDRVEIFKGHVAQLGEAYYREVVDDKGVTRIRYTSVVGKLLEKRGMTVGDKAMCNDDLPEFIREGSPETVCVYFSQMWAEDGSFAVRPNQSNLGGFRWDRAVALHDPTKNARYGLDLGITQKHIELVRKFGDRITNDLFGPQRHLTGRSLRNLGNSPNESVSSYACELHNIVLENPNRLMVSEMRMLKEKLGIMTTPYLARITFYEGTGRLSSLWSAQTNSNMDAIRAAILTTPDDIKKKRATEEWLRTRRNQVQVAKKKLEEEGLL